jgi:hypothetical protein
MDDCTLQASSLVLSLLLLQLAALWLMCVLQHRAMWTRMQDHTHLWHLHLAKCMHASG